ncbi:MAG: indolepyruvate oxidoreductase subunit beta [Desulfobacteraceae bacterium]|nr:indolepyruvate oxidoreductase subunit beta [Desulfobacteraceae bacterium]
MTKNKKTTNILIVGTGGQGVVLASEILSYVAVESGFDAKKSEIHGMSQRGGVVSSHVRFGNKVASPTIMAGDADILLSFELAEAVRWLPYLAPGGKAAVSNQRIVPPIVTMGAADYPGNPEKLIIEQARDAVITDAQKIAGDLGNTKLVNTIMLGVISNYLNLPKENWKKVISGAVPQKFRDLNLVAFEKGCELG